MEHHFKKEKIVNTAKKMAANGFGLVGSTILENPEMAITFAKPIYDKLTEKKRRPLVDRETADEKYLDRTRYNRLCYQRIELRQEYKIPTEWILDHNSCPQYVFSGMQSSKYLKKMKTTIREINHPQKSSVITILNCIEKVFTNIETRCIENKSLLNRKEEWKFFRRDGVEAMFFMDLATWTCDKLSNYNTSDPETINKLELWINYCVIVKDEVLFCRSNSDIVKNKDPRRELQEIINNLQKIKENTIKHIKAESFNDKINKLRYYFENLYIDTFNFLYLLSNNAQRSELIVSDLMAYTKKTEAYKADPQLVELINTTHGQWLAQTLDKAGIYDETFETSKEIDVDSIENYLSVSVAQLATINPTQSGLWSFAQRQQYQVSIGLPISHPTPDIIYFEFKKQSLNYTVFSPLKEVIKATISQSELEQLDININPGVTKNELKTIIENNLFKILDITSSKHHTLHSAAHAASYLHQISQIHRKLLLVINSIHTIIDSAEVKTTYGKSWVYRADTDYAIMDQLSYTLQESAATLVDQINDLWCNLYTNHYKICWSNKDHTDFCYAQLSICDTTVSSLNKTNNNIVTVLNDLNRVRHDSANHPTHFLEYLKNLKKILSKSTIVLNKILPSDRRREFNTLENQYEETESRQETKSSPIDDVEHENIKMNYNNDPNIISLNINIQQEDRGIFDEIVKALHSTTPLDIDCLTQPAKFHTQLQENLYNTFLVANKKVMELNTYFSFLRGISIYKIQDLTLLYSQINKSMRAIYNTAPLRDLSPQESHLIDILLYNHVTDSFEKHNFYPYTLTWDTRPLNITTQTDQSYVVTYDPFRSSESKKIEAYSIENHILQEQINTLERECVDLNNKIRLKDAAIQENLEVLMEKEQTIIQNQLLLVEANDIISRKDLEFDQLKNSLEILRNSQTELSLTLQKGWKFLEKSRDENLSIQDQKTTTVTEESTPEQVSQNSTSETTKKVSATKATSFFQIFSQSSKETSQQSSMTNHK